MNMDKSDFAPMAAARLNRDRSTPKATPEWLAERERRVQAEMERVQKELAELAAKRKEWAS